MSLKSIVFVVVCFLFNLKSHAQSTVDTLSGTDLKYPANKIVGTWIRCTSAELDANFDCGNDTAMVYTFSEDGTFFNNQKMILYGKTYRIEGVWTYDNQVLMTDLTDLKGYTSPPSEISIIWIDPDLFYHVGCEGADCKFKVYVYYQKVK